MGIEQIIEALGDKAGLVEEIKGVYGNNEGNVSRIGVLETELSGAINKKKSLQELVRKATGIQELSEDNLMKFSSNADDGLKADNETLQGKLAELQGLYDGLSASHESEISEMILKDTMRGLGIGERMQNDRAFSELTKLVLDGAVRDGATFTFKEDGKTIFGDGGKAMNVEDRISQLQEGEFSYLFKTVTGGGGGQGKAPSTSHTSAANDNERAAMMMKKMGHRA